MYPLEKCLNRYSNPSNHDIDIEVRNLIQARRILDQQIVNHVKSTSPKDPLKTACLQARQNQLRELQSRLELAIQKT